MDNTLLDLERVAGYSDLVELKSVPTTRTNHSTDSWSETCLTEPWANYHARKKAERQHG